MKKHIFFVLFLILLSGLFSIYPVKYHRFSEPVKDFPSFTSYKQALSNILPSELYKRAGSHKCGDYVIPVSVVEGNSGKFSHLADDINIAIQTYSGWKLSVDKDLKEKMIKRADQRFKTWGAMDVSKEMIETAQSHKKVAMNTRYSAQAKCYEINSRQTDNIKIVVTINDEKKLNKLFDIPVFFTADEKINSLKKEHEEKLKQLAILKQRSELGVYALFVTGAVFIFYLFFFTAFKFVNLGKIKKRKQFFLNEIEKREELINEGHYVTALELADDFLKYFPEDTKIKAFRERLLDYTGNDPKKAQEAFVQWKKLQMRMHSPGESGIYLSEHEKKKISPLIEYHPELKTSYLQLEKLDNQKKEELNREYNEKYNKALGFLKSMEMEKAKEILLQTASSHNDSLNLTEEMKKQPLKSFKLKSYSTGIELLVFTKDKISIGRGDESIQPDIIQKDRRVSRSHLDIEICSDKAVLINRSSTSGTFLNGDPVSESILKNNDLLNLAKVIDYDVFLMDENRFSSLFLNGSNEKILILREFASLNLSEKGIRFSGEDVQFYIKDNTLIMFSDTDLIVPDFGKEISVKGNSYKIEEI